MRIGISGATLALDELRSAVPHSRTLPSPGFWTRESPATAVAMARELGSPVTVLPQHCSLRDIAAPLLFVLIFVLIFVFPVQD